MNYKLLIIKYLLIGTDWDNLLQRSEGEAEKDKSSYNIRKI